MTITENIGFATTCGVGKGVATTWKCKLMLMKSYYFKLGLLEAFAYLRKDNNDIKQPLIHRHSTFRWQQFAI
jgi:hypothetical protein